MLKQLQVSSRAVIYKNEGTAVSIIYFKKSFFVVHGVGGGLCSCLLPTHCTAIGGGHIQIRIRKKFIIIIILIKRCSVTRVKLTALYVLW